MAAPALQEGATTPDAERRRLLREMGTLLDDLNSLSIDAHPSTKLDHMQPCYEKLQELLQLLGEQVVIDNGRVLVHDQDIADMEWDGAWKLRLYMKLQRQQMERIANLNMFSKEHKNMLQRESLRNDELQRSCEELQRSLESSQAYGRARLREKTEAEQQMHRTLQGKDIWQRDVEEAMTLRRHDQEVQIERRIRAELEAELEAGREQCRATRLKLDDAKRRVEAEHKAYLDKRRATQIKLQERERILFVAQHEVELESLMLERPRKLLGDIRGLENDVKELKVEVLGQKHRFFVEQSKLRAVRKERAKIEEELRTLRSNDNKDKRCS